MATGSQQAVGGATLTPGWSLAAVTSDDQGNYTVGDRANPPSNPSPLTISQPGFISHDVWIGWQSGARANVQLDIIRDAPPFSMEFYQQLVRDMYDKSDGSPWPVLRWEMSPSFYVRTLDQDGRPVEPEVLAVTLDALRRAVPGFTAGRYSAAAIETGTDTRPSASGWINVDFRRESDAVICGRAFVGRNPGTITLYEDVCSCGSVKVPGSVTMHEVGHAMGFFHVADRDSLMYPFDSGGCRAGTLSAAESFHAGIAYSRPRHNTDPDKDPSSAKTIGAGRPGPMVQR
jgi:matrixin